MINITEVVPRSIFEIANEWDMLAQIRFDQITSGSDVTFSKIMLPSMFDLIHNEKLGSILDAGCGVGILTDFLGRFFPAVTGIDPSKVSIDIAQAKFGYKNEFLNESIEQYAVSSKKKFDVITANMVLMDAPNAFTFIKSASYLLKRGGALIFSITHPCFWPEYYGYAEKEWFDYNREIFIESPFRISNDQDISIISTHIHRPLERYSSIIRACGLQLELIREPFPNPKTQRLYPSPWSKPRYMIFVCRKPRRLS